MPRALRIATFNLESLDDDPRAKVPFAERCAALRPQLEGLAADVLCLQEVHAQKDHKHGPRRLRALDVLLEGTSYASFDRVSTLREGAPSDVHNLVILSRFPVVASRQVRNELCAAPIYRATTADPPGPPAPLEWDRPLLHAQLDVDGATLHVIDLHLRAPLASNVPGQKVSPFVWRSVRGWAEGFYVAAMKRAGQALEARLLVDAIFDDDPDARIVVAGDLNADEHETPVRVLRGDGADTGNPALAARVLVPVERDVARESRYSVVHAGARQCLDHVLVSPAIARGRHRVTIDNGGLRDETSGEPVAGSFHAPIVAEIEV